MSNEIYAFTQSTVTPERFDLSDEELSELAEKGKAALAEVGGERLLFLGRVAGEVMLHVNKFPSIDAYYTYLKALWDMKVAKYWTLKTDLYRKPPE